MSKQHVFLLLLLSSPTLNLAGSAKQSFHLPACPVVDKTAAPARDTRKVEPISLPGEERPKKRVDAVEQARKINAVPLPLVQSEEELDKQTQLGVDAERRQLTELWSATINRSEDIRFVLSALQPTSDPKHSASTTMKFVSGALFNVVQSAPLLLPSGSGSMPLKLGAGLAGGMLSSLFSEKQSGQAQISREQGCILYCMIRNIADRLVEYYRNYRSALDGYEAAKADLSDLESSVACADGSWAPSDYMHFQYSIQNVRRELRAFQQRVLLHRGQLADLAGGDAVRKLEVDIASEKDALARLNLPEDRLAPPGSEFAVSPVPILKRD